MKIAILTYNRPHRKTQDLISRLFLRNIKFDIFTVPFEERKIHRPLFPHRPQIAYEDKLYRKPLDDSIDTYDAVLIGGANILDHWLVSNVKVINSHPGYLPDVRGLDALKWAIYENQYIGVTTYVVENNVDSGMLIEREILNPEPIEEFTAFAYRLYDLEIEMLARAPFQEVTNIHLESKGEVHKRMNHRTEIVMMERYRFTQKIGIGWYGKGDVLCD